jgi:hypothetical protein
MKSRHHASKFQVQIIKHGFSIFIDAIVDQGTSQASGVQASPALQLQ